MQYRLFLLVLFLIFIRLELKARLRPNIVFTLRDNLAVFMGSDITPLRVNRFGQKSSI